LIVAMLSATGIYLWWKKRRLRMSQPSLQSELAGA
jgi:hypothetical protein